METIKNAIWGSTDKQTDTEPVSGQTGEGTIDKPYDGGNAPGIEGSNEGITDGTTGGTTENFFGRDRGGPEANNLGPHQTSIANKLDPNVDSDGDGKPRSGPTDYEHGGISTTGTSSSGPFSGSSSSYSGTEGRLGGDASGTGASSTDYTHNDQPNTLNSGGSTSDYTSASGAQATGGAPIGTQQSHDKTGVTGIHSSDIPYSSKETSSANAPSTSDIGQSRAPAGGVGAGEPSVSALPTSTSGTDGDIQGGEKPLQEPGSDGSGLGHSSSLGGGSVDRRQSLVDGGEGGVGPLNAKEKGTGEKYVKSSGMAAEGGNFDAAAPGAAKEANRLLEEKGVDRSSGSNTGEVHRAPGDSTDKEKVSLGQKLKEKLHIGSHKEKS